MITAIVFIQTEVSQISEAASAIADIDGVSEVYSVTGDHDLIAMVRVRSRRSDQQDVWRDGHDHPDCVPGLQHS